MTDRKDFPTPIAQVESRLRTIGPNSSADTFLVTSYLSEVAIKAVATALYGALRDGDAQHSYQIGHDLVRADGVGTWTSSIDLMTSMPLSSFLPPELGVVVEWYTRKRSRPEDAWCKDAVLALSDILSELGNDSVSSGRVTVRLLASALVQIRNKARAHGALGPDFFDKHNARYIKAVDCFIAHCPLFDWQWKHLSFRTNKIEPHGVLLSGLYTTYIKDAEVKPIKVREEGVFLQAPSSAKLFFLGDLLWTTPECKNFTFPNGAFDPKTKSADALDYFTGKNERRDFSKFSTAPAPLPKSETQGLIKIDVQSNVFGNLPSLPKDYVSRPILEKELTEKICDQNHEIISLHGNGGMGKTYLALSVAHQLSNKTDRFDSIVWFSARDLDLRVSGPKAVKPEVVTITDVFTRYAALFEVGGDQDTFALILQGTGDRKRSGTLFIFDNFETMEDLKELHKFLDQHTTSPNKVLLTTRERAFKADYPIEVKGMEEEEASSMLNAFAAELNVTAILTSEAIESIYAYTGGHPYIMKVIVGEIAKERRFVPPTQVLSSRLDVSNAVFERSFKKLSDDARSIFLCIANWKSLISELSLLVVLGHRGVNVEAGLEECVRLSLIYFEETSDQQRLYFAPELARTYGKRKLAGDPDKLVIQSDLETLRRFGVTSNRDQYASQKFLVDRFISACKDEAKHASIERREEINLLLETLATLWPEAWLELARFSREIGQPSDQIDAALRHAVEEDPSNVDAWIERADLARATGNESIRIASLVSAVDADPSRIDLLKETAFQLAKYIKEQEIPPARRSIYLSSVRSHMQKAEDKLDAVALSRLAWLFMLDGDKASGRKYAQLGLTKEPDNNYCLKIVETADSWGY